MPSLMFDEVFAMLATVAFSAADLGFQGGVA
jgi:hypothetical protein